MMEGFRQWLMALGAAAILCAGAEGLLPPGGTKKVGKLVCSLTLLWVALSPLANISFEGWEEGLALWQEELVLGEEELARQADREHRQVIEEFLEAYISHKAQEMGVPCRVEVDCARDTEGLWLPLRARLWGGFTDVQQSGMTRILETELGIPIMEQSYFTGEGERG